MPPVKLQTGSPARLHSMHIAASSYTFSQFTSIYIHFSRQRITSLFHQEHSPSNAWFFLLIIYCLRNIRVILCIPSRCALVTSLTPSIRCSELPTLLLGLAGGICAPGALDWKLSNEDDDDSLESWRLYARWLLSGLLGLCWYISSIILDFRWFISSRRILLTSSCPDLIVWETILVDMIVWSKV